MRNVEVGPRQAQCGEHGLARTRRVGPGWAQVGALLANVDPKLRDVADMWVETVHLDDVGLICKMTSPVCAPLC